MSAFLQPWVRDLLRCPVGLHPLLEDTDDDGHPVLVCAQDCPQPGSRRHYPVRDGIPVLLEGESVVTPRAGGRAGA